MDIVIEDYKWIETLFEDSEPREEGLHLSEVITSLMTRAGMMKKMAKFDDLELTAEIGLLWERALSKIMREKYAVRPPQIRLDGIWMSPDGLSHVEDLGSLSIGPDPQGEVPVVVEEYKTTWQSTKRSPSDNFKYMMQVKAYCKAIGTNVAVMRIFYVMGDYKGSGPICRVARIKFTDEELDQNWDMLLKEKERMESECKTEE